MKEYTVTYTIQIDANNPRQAAEIAFEYIKDSDPVFEVFEFDNYEDKPVFIDLAEEPEFMEVYPE